MEEPLVKNVKLPVYFYNLMNSWNTKLPSVESKQLRVALAIKSYDDKINSMSASQRKKLDESNALLCKKWIKERIIDEDSKGFKK